MLRKLGAEIREYKGKVKAQRVALALLFGLQVMPPVIGAGSTSAYLAWPDKKITITETEVENYKLPKKFTALDYLNVATSITHRQSHDMYNLCKEYVSGTYDTYRKLLRFNSRTDLEENVRVTSSFMNPHVWLQVKDGEQWINYEPDKLNPPESPSEIPKYSQRMRIHPRPMEDNYAIEGTTNPGGNVVLPKLWTFANPMNITFWKRLKGDPADEKPEVVGAANGDSHIYPVRNLYK